MAYYSVLDVSPTDDAWIPDYLPTANERVVAHGGKHKRFLVTFFL